MSLRDLLAHSIASQEFVRLHRESMDESYFDGRVLAIGEDFILAAVVQNGYRPNGVVWLRIADLSAIDLPSPRDATATRVLELRGESLDARGELAVDSVARAVATASERYGLVTLYTELTSPDECTVGTPIRLDEDGVELQLVDPDARWLTETERFDFADITRIDAGGEYESALQMLLSANANA